MPTYIINLGNGLYIGEGKSILNGLQVAFKNVPKQAASKWDKKFALPYMDKIKKQHPKATLEPLK